MTVNIPKTTIRPGSGKLPEAVPMTVSEAKPELVEGAGTAKPPSPPTDQVLSTSRSADQEMDLFTVAMEAMGQKIIVDVEQRLGVAIKRFEEEFGNRTATAIDESIHKKIVFTQVRKRLQFPPVSLKDGGISLLYNHDPERAVPELRIPENAGTLVKFGYGVHVPDGFVAEVSVAGIIGQRVVCAHLVGETRELVLNLRTNNPSLPMVRAGEEVARVYLRKMEPAEVEWVEQPRS